MREAFIEGEDLQWLKDGHLKGVTLPTEYADFKMAVLQGNEDAPYAVNLYVSAAPTVHDNYFRIVFPDEPMIYCEGQVMKGDPS